MTNTLIAPQSAPTRRDFAAVGGLEGDRHIVRVSGELDLDSGDLLIRTCARAEPSLDIVVDLSALTFMDCAGYGAVMHARAALISHGGTLTLANGSGEPARLLALIGNLERDAGQNVVS